MKRVGQIRMAEFVFRLLPEAEHDRIERLIRADRALAAQYGVWVDVAGKALTVQWDGPVPDVLPQVHERLWGRRRAWHVSTGVVLLGLGLVTVLIVKAYVLGSLWPLR